MFIQSPVEGHLHFFTSCPAPLRVHSIHLPCSSLSGTQRYLSGFQLSIAKNSGKLGGTFQSMEVHILPTPELGGGVVVSFVPVLGFFSMRTEFSQSIHHLTGTLG